MASTWARQAAAAKLSMMAVISLTLRSATVWRQPLRAIFKKWMICGTTFAGPLWRTVCTSFARPGMNSSLDRRSSGPLLALATPMASMTINPTPPRA